MEDEIESCYMWKGKERKERFKLSYDIDDLSFPLILLG